MDWLRLLNGLLNCKTVEEIIKCKIRPDASVKPGIPTIKLNTSAFLELAVPAYPSNDGEESSTVGGDEIQESVQALVDV